MNAGRTTARGLGRKPVAALLAVFAFALLAATAIPLSTARAAATPGDAYVAVSVSPGGSGTVADNLGDTCGPSNQNGSGQCTFAYGTATVFDQNVTFTATAGPGEVFSGWNGTGADSTTCTGQGSPVGSCTLEIRGFQSKPVDYSLSAAFAPATTSPSSPPPTPSTSRQPAPAPTSAPASAPGTSQSSTAQVTTTLTVSVTGPGTVTSRPGGIDCGNGEDQCSAVFPGGASVVLTAVPGTGSSLTAWSGACATASPSTASGPASCTVGLGVSSQVSATFAAAPTPSSAAGGFVLPTAPKSLGDAVFIATPAPGVTAKSYGWDFEGTGHPVNCPASAPVAIHQFTHGGTFQVALQVADPAGHLTTSTQSVHVAGPTTANPNIAQSAKANVACAAAPGGYLGGALTSEQSSLLCPTTVSFDYSTVTALDGCFTRTVVTPQPTAQCKCSVPHPLSQTQPGSELPDRANQTPPPNEVPATFSAQSPPQALAMNLAAGSQSGTNVNAGASPILQTVSNVVWMALDSVDFNGLRIDSLEPHVAVQGLVVQRSGAPIFVDPLYNFMDVGHAKVSVTGSARANSGSPIVLSRDSYIDVDLKDTYTPTRPINFLTFDLAQLPAGSAGVYGFGLQGYARTTLQGDTITIDTNLPLPAPLQMIDGSPVTAEATFTCVAGGGLQLQSLLFNAQDIDLGPFVLNDLHVAYDEPSDSWQAQASVYILDEAQIQAAMAFSHGSLQSASASLTDTDPGQPIVAPFFYLNNIAFSLTTTSPVGFTGSAEFTVGGAYSTPFGVFAPAKITGQVQYTGPNGNQPWSLGLTGNADIVGMPLDGAAVTYYDSGVVTFSGGININPYNLGVIQISAALKGGADNNGDFDADVNANICVLWGAACAGGEFVVSSAGIGACIGIHHGFFHLHIGGGYSWGASGPRIMWDSCGVGPWQVSLNQNVAYELPRTQGSGAVSQTYTFPADGSDEQVIGITGAGGPPTVTVAGPGGATATSQPGNGVLDGQIYTVESPHDSTTYVVICQPSAGSSWKVSTASGSTPVTQVRHAAGMPTPSVTGTVVHQGSGTSSGWALNYKIQNRDGAKVRFEEVGSSTRQTLGTVAADSGSLPFTPGLGQSGRRTIQAELIADDGAVLSIVPVAVYDAPQPPRTGAPTALSAVPQNPGTGLTVRWNPPGAGPKPTRYVLEARLSDGRRVQNVLPASQTTDVLPAVYTDETGTIQVAGETADGVPGAFAALSLPTGLSESAGSSSGFWSTPWPYAALAAVLIAAGGALLLARRRTRS